ncbi:hypothetical protein GCM10009558_056440 [Virgisporangium aurantiacum]
MRLVLRGDDGYEEARVGRVFNARRPDRYPAAVLLAADDNDVVTGVKLARERGWRVSVRSGGHSWAAWSVRDDALLIDLGALTAVDYDPAGLDWIDRAVDRNSTSELAALARAATAPAGQALDFTDSVEVKGSVADVYEFLYRADAWPERLPHVARVALTEETPGVQTLEMDTGSPDGSTHTTRSVRICWPAGRIVYKQTELPALLGVHTGEWRLTGGPEVVVASSRHVVRIDPTAVPAVLGPDATVDEAAAKVRAALSTNSLTTLRAAKAYAEERRDG